MSSDALMVVVYSKHGNVTMRMIVEMDLMKLIAITRSVVVMNLLVLIVGVYLCLK